MPFLVIAGIPVDVHTTNATQDESARQGRVAPAFAGNLRSDVSAERRRWTFELVPMSQADTVTFLAAIAGGVFVDVSGDAIGGTISAYVVATRVPYLADGTVFVRTVLISVEEVTPGGVAAPPPPPSGLPVTSGLVWDYDPSYVPPASGDQTHEARVGPQVRRGSTTGSDTADPTFVAASGGVPGHWSFDADDYLFVPDHAGLDGTWVGDFTLIACVQIGAGSTETIFNRDDEGANRELWADFDSGAPRLTVCYGGSAGNRTQYVANAALGAGKHVLGFTHDPALSRLLRGLIYVGGAAVARTGTDFGSDGTLSPTAADTRLGRRGNSNAPVPKMYRVLVYDRVLTATEHDDVADYLIAQGWA